MALSAEEHTQARGFLLALPGPAASSDAAGYAELARLSHEGAELLTSALDATRYGVEPPSAHDVAGHHRRRAHALAHLAARHPQYEEPAHLAITMWQLWEDRVTEDVLTAAGARHAHL
ncbi:hypothetical protein QMK19_29015 [Streptomyces sp. H10-C2]|uniref:hypothetical protein n=1 Tax=Streptomyces TaxID=1883 RepID=UPI0018DFF7A9|nr:MULTISPECIES: hypothetical protein [Streptomyces]MDJ0344252.1 hypothetical protein [Streptomyces sp. PH10-H1]MDJ0373590.1 hypothetical protein [Streptomyces sp. H10-C2]